MNRREFQKYIDRDLHCPHCGSTDDTLVPNHRANRGHGGYKAGNAPSNILVMCARINGLIEASSLHADIARDRGWKLSRWGNSRLDPFFDVVHEAWFVLDDNYGRHIFFGKRRSI